jgi:hypothetical protein
MRRREKFSIEEDDRLRELVARFGTNSWESVAKGMPGRNVRQCRERWKHYVCSPDTKAPWSNDEDKLLFEKMVEIGPKWTKLAAWFPGRTDIQIKSRWMQRFAKYSNLHIRHRVKKFSGFAPPMPCAVAPAPTHVQFVPVHVYKYQLLPKPPAPDAMQDWGLYNTTDGSRSFESFLSSWNGANEE